MAYYTLDTSTIISRSLTELPDEFLLSSVVLMELMSSARDESERRSFEGLCKAYALDNSLIVPDAADWLMASKVLYWLTHGRRRTARGRTPRLEPGASQRMALDTLIAASARRWKTTVITDNWDDFRAIQKYCDVKIIRAIDFFG